MKIRVNFRNPRLKKAAAVCRRAAGRQGVPVYLVGGFVRDAVLKRANEDLDFIVVGDAITLARAVARQGKRKVTTYRQFGTATVDFPGGVTVDLAMARREEYARPGALPSVRPGNLHDDLYRRDFTVNALALSLGHGGLGEIVDIYNGLADIRKKMIRVLHRESFMDDPTRILRAVRFEQRFGFSIEPLTSRCLRQALRRGVLKRVGPARYFQELRKVLKETCPLACLERLHRLGALTVDGRPSAGSWRLLRTVGRRITVLRGKALYGHEDFGWLYWMALCEGLTEKTIRRLAAGWQLTRQEKESLITLRRREDVVRQLTKKDLTPGEAARLLRGLPVAMVHYLRVRCSSPVLGRRIDRYLARDRFVRLAIGGNDLRRMGLPPGKETGAVLERLLLGKVNGAWSGRDAEIREARRIVARR